MEGVVKGRRTEGELLEGPPAGLRVEHVDDEELEGNPATVDGEVAPPDGVEGDGVDVRGEETRELAEDLLDGDTAAALSVGPELNEVGYSVLASLRPGGRGRG